MIFLTLQILLSCNIYPTSQLHILRFWMASTEQQLGDPLPSLDPISKDELISRQDQGPHQSDEILEAVHAEREPPAATEDPQAVSPEGEFFGVTEHPQTAQDQGPHQSNKIIGAVHAEREPPADTEDPQAVSPEGEFSAVTEHHQTGQDQGPHQSDEILGAVHAQRELPAATEDPQAVSPEGEFSTVTEHPQTVQSGSIAAINQEDDRPVVLVTNDDGIQAPGLRALVEALVDGGQCNVYVCAPDFEKSGVGHCITTRETLAVTSVDIERVTAYELSGTPADCVSLSLSGVLFSSKKPSLVLSGINKGSNCGYHIFYSGTVAGAREAFICGVPSMSLSLNWKRGQSSESDFKVAAGICLPLIHAALHDIEKGVFPKGFFLNIDVPTNPAQHKGFRVTRQGTMRSVPKWRIASSHRGMFGAGLCKENTIGKRLAQLGLAASAVGAARRMSSPLKNTEIESVAGPENGSEPSNFEKTKYYRNEFVEIEAGEVNIDYDYGALQAGYVTVTPLGLLTYLETESFSRAADWIAASVELVVPSAL